VLSEIDTALGLQLIIGAAVFLLGALVKGILGVGMPLVVAPLLSLFVSAPMAVALLGMPVLVSNTMQSLEGGLLRYSLSRFGWLIAFQVITTIMTVKLTLNLSVATLDTLLALSVLIATFFMAFSFNMVLPARHERWAGVLVGLASGLMSGVSSLTGPLIIAYLMALKLQRDMFVGSISIIYLSAAVPLYGALWWYGRMGWTECLLSALALIPVVLGLRLGRMLRHRISELWFRRILLWFLVTISLILIIKSA
jgi:uncharacterized membrane protein YfcA